MRSLPPTLSTLPTGERIVGEVGVNAGVLMAAGTPRAAKLVGIVGDVSLVWLGDRLPVDFDGKYWWVSRDGSRLGRLTWSVASRGRPDPRTGVPMHMITAGTLVVHQLALDENDRVVNCGGFVMSG